MSDVPRRIMRLKEVMHVSGLGRSSIYNYMAAGKFPKSHPLGGGIVGWDSAEVQRWIDAVLDGREWKPLPTRGDLPALKAHIDALTKGVDVDLDAPLSHDDD